MSIVFRSREFDYNITFFFSNGKDSHRWIWDAASHQRMDLYIQKEVEAVNAARTDGARVMNIIVREVPRKRNRIYNFRCDYSTPKVIHCETSVGSDSESD